MRSFLFLLCGARSPGNSEWLARKAAEALPGDVLTRWINLSELALPAFEDRRHEREHNYGPPSGNAGVLFDATLHATDLVFVVPLYWYSVPAAAKLYLDHWSGWLRAPDADFKARMAGKVLWVVSAYSDPDESYAEPLLGTLKRTAQYMDMRWGGALLGRGNRPGDIAEDVAAIEAAATFFDGAPLSPE